MPYQVVGQKRLTRTMHVWVKRPRNGDYKCVLCGGVTAVPTDDCDVERYERLTAEERALCPMT